MKISSLKSRELLPIGAIEEFGDLPASGNWALTGSVAQRSSYPVLSAMFPHPKLSGELQFTQRVAGCTYPYRATYCSGLGMFMVSSYYGVTWTSTDGITWTKGFNPLIVGATYGISASASRFVMSSYTGIYSYSNDGINWIAANNPGTANHYDIMYQNGAFFSINNASAGLFERSLDGITWTANNMTSINNNYIVRCYASNGTKLIALPFQGSQVFTSLDNGTTWTASAYSVIPTSMWVSLVYGAGLFVAISTNSLNYVTSPDGVTWTLRTFPTYGAWSKIVWTGSKFVIIGSQDMLLSSTDGINWTINMMPIGFSSSSFTDLASNGSILVTCIGNAPGNIFSSSPSDANNMRLGPSMLNKYVRVR